jgi:hypothetical protein
MSWLAPGLVSMEIVLTLLPSGVMVQDQSEGTIALLVNIPITAPCSLFPTP